MTAGFSGADLANICNEAALIAARKKKHSVDKQDFLDAVDRVIGGLEKKNKIITTEEKKAIAYHDTVAPKMEIIRNSIDKLELIVADDLWTLPKYRELLFIR